MLWRSVWLVIWANDCWVASERRAITSELGVVGILSLLPRIMKRMPPSLIMASDIAALTSALFPINSQDSNGLRIELMSLETASQLLELELDWLAESCARRAWISLLSISISFADCWRAEVIAESISASASPFNAPEAFAGRSSVLSVMMLLTLSMVFLAWIWAACCESFSVPICCSTRLSRACWISTNWSAVGTKLGETVRSGTLGEGMVKPTVFSCLIDASFFARKTDFSLAAWSWTLRECNFSASVWGLLGRSRPAMMVASTISSWGAGSILLILRANSALNASVSARSFRPCWISTWSSAEGTRLVERGIRDCWEEICIAVSAIFLPAERRRLGDLTTMISVDSDALIEAIACSRVMISESLSPNEVMIWPSTFR